MSRAGAAVVVHSSAAVDPAQPFVLKINLGGSSLALADATENLIVIYKIQIFAENRVVLGVLPRSALTIEGQQVSFSTPHFGVFQTAYAQQPVTEAAKVTVTDGVQTKREVAKLPPLSITSRTPFVVGAEKEVVLSGTNFRPSIKLAMGGKAVGNIRVLSDSSVSFTTPVGGALGLAQLTADQDGISQTVSLIYSGSESDFTVSTRRPEAMCAGTQYYNGKGQLTTGTKQCSASATTCTTDGQADCVVAGPNYAALLKSGAQNKILSGQMLGGVAGNVVLPAAGKVLSGTSYGEAGNGSIGTLSLPAAAKVRVSAGSYGDPGSPFTGTLADCADGDFGCYVVGPSFKAVAVTGSTGDKILFGQTLAGISGTVTLPLASQVLTGTSYGIGGNGLTGSLTVPAAGNVLSGSGTYGDALSLLTPTLTLPATSKVLSGTSFGVGGSTLSGTLTLPTAGHVLAGSGSYGDSLSQTSPTYACPVYVRPASPSIASINFNLAPDRVTVNWEAVAGAAGYIVIMRSNGAISWTPTDGQAYGTGAQGVDIIIYSGTGTSVTYNADVTAGITYSFAVYSHIANNIYSYLPSTSSLTSCAGLSGSWVAVPGDSTYGTSGFCVMKYEAKNVGGTATSQAADSPWVNISQTAAQDACLTLGANFHLITNDEWMSLASNIASTASNWSGGSVGSGAMNRGHSDSNPGSACAASADDSYGYVETNCAPLNSGTWSQKRTHTLSTGAVIWDVGGNVWDWTSYVIANNNAKPYVTADGTPQNAWRELSAINNGFTAMTLHDLRPIHAEKTFWSDAWNSTQGVGQYLPGSNGSGGALLRGANWNAGLTAGVFSASLNYSPTYAYSDIGFRCTRVTSP